MFIQSAVRARWSAVLTVLAMSAAPASSQTPLTLAEALRLAEGRAPGVSSLDAAARGAREMAVSANQLPDPVLRAGLDNVPVNGPDAFTLDRDFMTMRRIGVMQEYVSVAKREARRDRGEREARRWEAEAAASRAELRMEVASAWYDRVFALRTETLLQELEREIAMQRRAAEAQVASAKAAPADVLAVDALLIQSRDRVIATRRQQQVAIARLARWLGDEASRSPAGDDGLPSASEVRALAEHGPHNIPQLRALGGQLDVAEAEVEVARTNRDPNWSWEIFYQHRAPSFSNMISVGVSVPLPIAREERQDREVAARLAQRDQARDQLVDAQRRHAAEFEAMRIEWLALNERQTELQRALLPIARQRVDALLAAYGSGQRDLQSVLEARRAEVDARIQVLDLERESARLWARLRFTYLEAEGAKP
jgi:outer membrane protein TolC